MGLTPMILGMVNPCLALAYKTVNFAFQLQSLPHPAEVLHRSALYVVNDINSNVILTVGLVGGGLIFNKFRNENLAGKVLQLAFGPAMNFHDLELLQQFSLVENCVHRLRDEAVLSAVPPPEEVEAFALISDVASTQNAEPRAEEGEEPEEEEESNADDAQAPKEIPDVPSDSTAPTTTPVAPADTIGNAAEVSYLERISDEELAGLIFLRESLLHVVKTHVDDVDEAAHMAVLQRFRGRCAFDSRRCLIDFYGAKSGSAARRFVNAVKEAGGAAALLRQLDQRLEAPTVSKLVDETLEAMRRSTIDALIKNVLL